MPIVSRAVEASNSSSIVVRCGDDVGKVYTILLFPVNRVNPTPEIDAKQVQLEAQLKEAELQQAVFSEPVGYVLRWATATELATWVRERYKTADRDELAVIAKRILDWISAGKFTDVQVRTAFGLNSSQWTTLKNKMTTLVANYSVLQAAKGE